MAAADCYTLTYAEDVQGWPSFYSFEPDWTFLAQSEVIKKISPIFAAMNWDITKIIADDKQKELEVWF